MGLSIHFDPLSSLIALVLAAFFCLSFFLSRSYVKPAFFYPSIEVQKKLVDNRSKSLKSKLALLPKLLLAMSAFLMMLALLNPTLIIPKKPLADSNEMPPINPVEGIALYLLLDQSGSMSEPAVLYREDGSRVNTTKLQMLKELTRDFIAGDPGKHLKGRGNDLIGLIEFARTAQIKAPLTLDHAAILKQIDQLKVVPDKDLDGTAIGYSIYKAAHLLNATKLFASQHSEAGEAAYEIKDSVILLVTDGLQDPNPLDYDSSTRTIDIPTAAKYAKDNGVRLYIVNVDPSIGEPKYAAQREQMKASAEITGGKFYLVGNTPANSLAQIYASINTLEKSQLPGQMAYEEDQKSLNPSLFSVHVPLFPYIIALALLLFLGSIFLDATYLRSSP